jgi:hypothetical protein
MEWQVTIDEEVKNVNLADGSTANDLVNHLELHPDSLLVVTDEEKMKPIPLISKLPDKPIRIILVASGG